MSNYRSVIPKCTLVLIVVLLNNPPVQARLKFYEYAHSKSLDFTQNEIEDLDDFHFERAHLSSKMVNQRYLLAPVCKKYERLDADTRTCHAVDTQGPCQPFMVFKSNEESFPGDSVYGHCECDHEQFTRPVVTIGARCYKLYTQALCEEGYMLTLKVTQGVMTPYCKMNPCGGGREELIPFHGICARINSPSLACPNKGDIVTFTKDSLHPVCQSPPRRLFRRQVALTNVLRCPKGYGMVNGATRCRKLSRVIVYDR